MFPRSPVADTEATPISPVMVITIHWTSVQSITSRGKLHTLIYLLFSR